VGRCAVLLPALAALPQPLAVLSRADEMLALAHPDGRWIAWMRKAGRPAPAAGASPARR